MGMSRDAFFRICLFTTLGFGILLSDFHYSRSPSWALFLLYILSAFLQRWIMAGKNFDVKSLAPEESARIEESRRLYYCGASLESETDDPESTAIREMLDPRRALFRKAGQIFIVTLYIYLLFRFGISLRAWDFFFIGGAIVFLMAATSGHMLLALGLNAVVAIPFGFGLDSLSGPLTAVYFLLCVITFSAHRFYEESRKGDRDEPEWLNREYGRMIGVAALGMVGIAGLAFCVNQLFPDPSPEKGISFVEKAVDLNHRLGAKWLSRAGNALPETDSKRAGTRPSGEEARRATQKFRAVLEERGTGPTRVDVETLRRALELAKTHPSLGDVGSVNPPGGTSGSAGGSGNGVRGFGREGKLSLAEAQKILSKIHRDSREKSAEIAKAARSLETSVEEAKRRGATDATGLTDEELENLGKALGPHEGERLSVTEAGKFLEQVPPPSPFDNSEYAQAARTLRETVTETGKRGESELPEIDPAVLEQLARGTPQSGIPLADAERALSKLPRVSEGDQTQKAEAIRSLEGSVKAGIKNGDSEVKGLSSNDLHEIGQALGNDEARESILKAEKSAARIENVAEKPVLIPHPEVPKPPEFISEEMLRKVVRFLKPLFLILSVLLIALFIRKIRAKHDPSKLEENAKKKLSRVEKRTLWQDLREIERAGLSVSEEVVARYQHFLKAMAGVNCAKPESLPPAEFREYICGTFPKLSGPFSTLTDVFCDVFYGERDLDGAGLGRFRADHRRILKSLL